MCTHHHHRLNALDQPLHPLQRHQHTEPNESKPKRRFLYIQRGRNPPNHPSSLPPTYVSKHDIVPANRILIGRPPPVWKFSLLSSRLRLASPPEASTQPHRIESVRGNDTHLHFISALPLVRPLRTMSIDSLIPPSYFPLQSLCIFLMTDRQPTSTSPLFSSNPDQTTSPLPNLKPPLNFFRPHLSQATQQLAQGSGDLALKFSIKEIPSIPCLASEK